ncbi:MAG TPA: AAA domain-containing protein [Xanthobacteraceae bacterium]|nr:AAA domain-containing protein [Xanthobacteraceae bacterium]
MGTLQEHLKGTIEYTEKLLSLGERVVFDVLAESVVAVPEQEFRDKDGITLDPDGGESWIQIRRLQETKAPDPGKEFEGWYDGDLKSPDKPPVLRETRMVKLDRSTIEKWIASGIINAEDVMEPLRGGTGGDKDVLLKADYLPEFRSRWNSYLQGAWSAWASVEKPRRKVAALYNKLYQIHQRMVSFGEDNPLELVMGVGVARWHVDGHKLTSTLIEQGVETGISEDGSFVVRPRSVAPIVNLKPFYALDSVAASEAVQRNATSELARLLEDSAVSFSPFDKSTFTPVLRMCANNLTSAGRYFPDDSPAERILPPLGEHLVVTDTWVLFARQRTEDIRRDDLKRLQDKVISAEDEMSLPAAARGFVKRPSNEQSASFDVDLPEGPLVVRPGIERAPAGAEVRQEKRPARDQVFFPLPFNEEQIEIAESLQDENTAGIVVQGPPGTGKTHTIANVICHYLAVGKNVLVTAKTPEALIAIQEKLPEAIRTLAISIVHDDRDGARQLEAAMTLLSEEAKQVKLAELKEAIQTRHQRLDAIRERRKQVDTELGAIARSNLERVAFRGSSLSPMELAEAVAKERSEHAWFPDRLAAGAKAVPLFDDQDIAAARDIRGRAKDNLVHPTECIPDPRSLLPTTHVVRSHQTLRNAAAAEHSIERGDTPMLIAETALDLEAARALDDFLDNIDNVARALPESGKWLKRAVLKVIQHQRSGGAEADAMLHLLARWGDLGRRGSVFLKRQIYIDEATQDQADLDVPLKHLAAGKKPFGILGLGKGDAKRRLDSISIEGRQPNSPAEWEEVRGCRQWHAHLDAFIEDWNAQTVVSSFFRFHPSWSRSDTANYVVSWRDVVERAGSILVQANTQEAVARRLFAYGIDFDAVFISWDTTQISAALRSNFLRIEAAGARSTREEIRTLGGVSEAPLHQTIREIAEVLGDTTTSDHVIAQSWQRMIEHAQLLERLRVDFARLDDVAEKIQCSGAPEWARIVRSVPGAEALPTSWRRTWEWACADAYVRRICDRDRLKALRIEQSHLEAEQKRLFAEIVRLRTFYGLKIKITDAVDAALARFATAIGRLGAGTGKAAPRYRRIIRDATADAAAAIPCWIIPEWRVSEQLPSDLGMFDLVIVDEASQSNVTALPAILRGKKVLIVGDDKQVSPTVVGIEERQIIQLRETYLKGHPLRDQLEPSTSLYDLAKIAFPGKVIMLREHFRCVEPIIRFSSQFYGGKLVPLRLPTATERLDPPLIDILVRGARRVREVNEGEAKVIIEEIRRLIEEPAFANRTIGVISLVGEKQAKLIHDRLVRDLGPVAMNRHRIMCGNAATFQGQERDIVFLSMVECPESARAKASRVFEQRFNVALSRARDRMILVRSVTLADLKSETDLKRKVIEHFRDPMKTGMVALPKNVLDLCQSDFEREVGIELITRGYRIHPQVPVGQYSLDFVVEGELDLRLAVECDGDPFHGPDRWAADLQRQRSLERAGWTFWRVWGSHWRADREGCISDLLQTLDALGIKPLGAATMSRHWTEHREVGEAPGDAVGIPPLDERTPIVSGFKEDTHSILVNELATKVPIEVDSVAALRTAEAQTSVALAVRAGGIGIGDWVTVRYVENNRVRKLRISADQNEPGKGIIWARSPLGAALLRATIDDEVEYELKPGENRVVLVQAIEPAQHGATP